MSATTINGRLVALGNDGDPGRPWAGESLRGKKNPTVTELLARRADDMAGRAGDRESFFDKGTAEGWLAIGTATMVSSAITSSPRCRRKKSICLMNSARRVRTAGRRMRRKEGLKARCKQGSVVELPFVLSAQRAPPTNSILAQT
jgi:hypothetical protein